MVIMLAGIAQGTNLITGVTNIFLNAGVNSE